MKSRISGFMLALAMISLPTTMGQANSTASLPPAALGLPSCALSCLMSSLDATSCLPSNTTCLCGDSDYQATATSCVQQSCNFEQMLATQNLTFSTCGFPVRDRSREFAIVALVFGVISAVIASIRLFHKIVINKRKFEVDDYLIVLIVAVSILSIVVSVRGMAVSGVGRDIWNLTIPQIVSFARNIYYNEIIYMVQVSLLKLTLLFFYQRVFPGQIIQRVIWGTLIFGLMFGLSFTVISIVQCQPIHYYWDQYDGVSQGYCIGDNAVAWANGAISIALDLWMLAIPLSQLSKLDLHWKKKIGVTMMFFVGTFVTMVSILRLRTLIHFANSSNPTWDEYETAVYSVVEINVGIICICMPALRVILMSMFPKVFGTGTIHSRRTSHDPKFFNPNQKNPYQRQSGQSGYSDGAGDMITPEIIAKRLQTPSPVSHKRSYSQSSSSTTRWSRSHRWSLYPHDDPDDPYNGHNNARRSYDVRYGTYQNGRVVWVNKPASPPLKEEDEEQPKSFFQW